jgi:predicted RNase H-like HicB family nuclease
MTYDVLVTRKDNKFIARVRAWPEIVAEGDSEEEVLHQAQADLQALLTAGRIVQISLDVESDEHPWRQFAGMFADDPDWDAFQAVIQQYREDINHSCTEE